MKQRRHPRPPQRTAHRPSMAPHPRQQLLERMPLTSSAHTSVLLQPQLPPNPVTTVPQLRRFPHLTAVAPIPVTDSRSQDRTEITSLKRTADSGLQASRATPTSNSSYATTTATSQSYIPPELAQILDQFEDVFPEHLPLGSPPSRHTDVKAPMGAEVKQQMLPFWHGLFSFLPNQSGRAKQRRVRHESKIKEAKLENSIQREISANVLRSILSYQHTVRPQGNQQTGKPPRPKLFYPQKKVGSNEFHVEDHHGTHFQKRSMKYIVLFSVLD